MKIDSIVDFVSGNIGYPIALGVGYLFKWLIEKRQNKAKAAGSEIDNETKLIENDTKLSEKWKEWAEKMEQSVSLMEVRLETQRRECDRETERLQDQISQHENRIFSLEKENNDLKGRSGK